MMVSKAKLLVQFQSSQEDASSILNLFIFGRLCF